MLSSRHHIWHADMACRSLFSSDHRGLQNLKQVPGFLRKHLSQKNPKISQLVISYVNIKNVSEFTKKEFISL
ncbi:hypothetical protein G3A_16810 [Bacillus sp. 17376]|nr:hypothetical protein G3A_16810 [Bacillus sp. 17376]